MKYSGLHFFSVKNINANIKLGDSTYCEGFILERSFEDGRSQTGLYMVTCWDRSSAHNFSYLGTTLSTISSMMSLATSSEPLMSPEAIHLAPRPSLSDSVNSIPPLPAASGEMLTDVISNGAFSKTWVLPPRKKPGRKAANDVPPTVFCDSNDSLMIETTSSKSSGAKSLSRSQGNEDDGVGEGE